MLGQARGQYTQRYSQEAAMASTAALANFAIVQRVDVEGRERTAAYHY